MENEVKVIEGWISPLYTRLLKKEGECAFSTMQLSGDDSDIPATLIIGDTAVPSSEAKALRDRVKVLEEAITLVCNGVEQSRSDHSIAASMRLTVKEFRALLNPNT